MKNTMTFSERFRGFMPVVIDVETGGFNHTTDALLEIAAVFIKLDKNGNFVPGNTIHNHIKPFFCPCLLSQRNLFFTPSKVFLQNDMKTLHLVLHQSIP